MQQRQERSWQSFFLIKEDKRLFFCTLLLKICSKGTVIIVNQTVTSSPTRLSSTIDCNVEFVHSQYSCILTSQVSTQYLCPKKIINDNDNFRLSAYPTGK